jgi:hypothetical protein
MKRLFSLLLFMGLVSVGMGQLKAKAKCADFYVDVLDGTVNGLKPSNTQIEIKEKFPCFTTAEEESGTSKCGGGIFFKDKDLYFYTRRKYVEIGPKFQGKTSIPLLGAKRGSLFTKLGNPKIKDDLWEAFDTQYGCLVLHYDVAGPGGKVKFFQFSTIGTDELNLCD